MNCHLIIFLSLDANALINYGECVSGEEDTSLINDAVDSMTNTSDYFSSDDSNVAFTDDEIGDPSFVLNDNCGGKKVIDEIGNRRNMWKSSSPRRQINRVMAKDRISRNTGMHTIL